MLPHHRCGAWCWCCRWCPCDSPQPHDHQPPTVRTGGASRVVEEPFAAAPRCASRSTTGRASCTSPDGPVLASDLSANAWFEHVDVVVPVAWLREEFVVLRLAPGAGTEERPVG